MAGPEVRATIGAQTDLSFGSTLQQVRRQFAEVMAVANARGPFEAISAGQVVFDHFRERLGGLAGPLARVVVGIGAAGVAMKLMGKASEIAGEGLKEFSDMETLEGQFRSLLGSTDKAQARLAELADFAGKTPYDLPGVANASRTLEVFTKGALSTGEGLRLVGDVAAQAGISIEEAATWIGRLYDGLQSGRPVGEAMARLQELGVVSGDVRAKLEAMQKAGVSGNEVWKAAVVELDKAKGAMAILGETLNGLLSSLDDAKKALMREVGKSFAEKERESIKGTMKAMEALTPVAGHAAEVLSDLGAAQTPHQWVPIFDAQLKSLVASILGAKDTLSGLIDLAAVGGTGIAAAIGVRAVGAFGALVKAASNGTGAVGTFFSFMARGIPLLFSPLSLLAAAIASCLVSLHLWSERAERTLQAQMELAKATVSSAKDIVTVTDKIKRLTEAYKEYAAAQKEVMSTKLGTNERTNAENRVMRAQVAIRQTEKIESSKLQAGEDRKKIKVETDAINMEDYEKGLIPTEKLALAQARLTEELEKQKKAKEALAKAEDAESPTALKGISAELDTRFAAYKQAQDQIDQLDANLKGFEEIGDVESYNKLAGQRQPLVNRRDAGDSEIERLTKLRDGGLTAAAESARVALEQANNRVALAKTSGVPDETGKVPAGRVGVGEAQKGVTEQNEKLAEATRDRLRTRQERKDAAWSRGIDRAEARGEITGTQADEQRARGLDRQRYRAETESDRLKQVADTTKDPEKQAQTLKEYQEQLRLAQSLGFQAEDLRNPLPQKSNAVADSLQRVGGGGGVFYGGGKNPLEMKADKTNALLEKLIEGQKAGKDKRPDVSRFG